MPGDEHKTAGSLAIFKYVTVLRNKPKGTVRILNHRYLKKDSSEDEINQDIVNVIQREAKAQEAGVPGAHIRLLEAADRLKYTIETPGDAMPLQNMCVRIIVENGVLPAICSENGQHITTEDLSRRTGAEELLTHRVLRLLATAGFVDEVGEKKFAANAVTQFANTPGMTGGLKSFFDQHISVASKMVELMRIGGGIHSFPDGPNETGPWQYAFDGKSFWETNELDHERKRDFDAYMAGRNQAGNPQWYEVYPAGKELAKLHSTHGTKPETVTLVDVGGNRGHDISSFKQRHSDLPGRFVLEDLPETIEAVNNSSQNDINLRGIELLAYDFFIPQPIEGARAYFFGNILHDWSDKCCQQLLSNTVAAMDPEHSRILIDDFVLPAEGCSIRPASLDIHMMFAVSGIERHSSNGFNYWTP
ncbi:MAG: hypothetical protein M1820_002701 [Bogoriella megaspora]|nr:MAG: hypothetical protein M1820_002701 [Bogoriella megaspora]